MPCGSGEEDENVKCLQQQQQRRRTIRKAHLSFRLSSVKKKHDEECLSFLPYLYSPIIIPLGVKYSWMGWEAINSQSMNS